MDIPGFLVDILHLVLKLPDIVFSDSFLVIVSALFTVGIFVKIVSKAVGL